MVGTTINGDFPSLADPLRRELTAHCYRMLGSVHDAEDLVQETYLRAWRSYDKFEGRSSLRTWLYRIATRACLTALESRGRRPLPTGLGSSSSDPADDLVERSEVPWLEPVPDALVDAGDGDPAAITTARETLRLALIAALQYLPPRQRAVLVLRDVLQWRAAEVAELLDVSTAAVNSMLQRARAQLAEAEPNEDAVDEPEDAQQRALLDRYVRAFEDKDITAIVELFTAEAVWEMPPMSGWYRGPEDIGELIDTRCPAGPDDMRLTPVSANGQPAFGVYMRGEDDVFRPFHLQVLSIGAEGVGHVVAFFDVGLFERFGLSPTHPGDRASTSMASPA